MDAAHGTLLSKYKALSFMAHDVFGKGQFVRHCALQSERRPTLSTAIEAFKSANPAWTKIQCVVIDKVFTELSVLITECQSTSLSISRNQVLVGGSSIERLWIQYLAEGTTSKHRESSRVRTDRVRVRGVPCIDHVLPNHGREALPAKVCKLSVVQHLKYDREMAHVASLVSEHVCELIYEQYEYAVHQASYNFYEPHVGMTLIKAPTRPKML
ncbi:hypothetical protein JG687_00014924 [Phytophthora cactorum]|uniref:ZSWIM1/3 RNaseH-like domain-containing protein n=1 Tax=Phytophthora cactorum TaxID=29920 RepID=A0A8T1TY51_9STRA|nr:hypothetical protein JG687_00014924 [Phytophthora cactorum]